MQREEIFILDYSFRDSDLELAGSIAVSLKQSLISCTRAEDKLHPSNLPPNDSQVGPLFTVLIPPIVHSDF